MSKPMSYEALCAEDNCYQVVVESDIERNIAGDIFERSKKCWDCRTTQDRTAIKRFRQKQNKLKTSTP